MRSYTSVPETVKGYGRKGPMLRTWFLASLAVLAIGCRKTLVQDAGVAAGQAAVPSAQPDAGLELTLSKLDGFLAYERLLRGEGVPSTREVRRLSQAVDGGGRALEEAYALMRRRTEEAEAVRADAGLSTAEIQSLETLTAEVALARAGAGRADLDEALRALDAAKEQLPPEQRASVQRTVERLRAQQERARTLYDVRARWGDAAVNLVLEREKPVLEIWGVPDR